MKEKIKNVLAIFFFGGCVVLGAGFYIKALFDFAVNYCN